MDVLLPSVKSLLSSSRSTDDISEELFDILGYDDIELVSDILQNRQAVLAEVCQASL